MWSSWVEGYPVMVLSHRRIFPLNFWGRVFFSGQVHMRGNYFLSCASVVEVIESVPPVCLSLLVCDFMIKLLHVHGVTQ